MVFFTKSKHLMTPKIKHKKIILTKLLFRQFYIEKIRVTRVFLWVTQKDRIRIRIWNTAWNT